MPRAWAEIDLAAVRHNVRCLVKESAPAVVCAVVKAGGYGHGAVPVAHAALDAGASWLAVATVEEADCLRHGGISTPVLLLSEPATDELEGVVDLDLRATVYTSEGIEGLAKAVARSGAPLVPVHLKIDTGMRRVGAHPDDARDRANAVLARPELRLEGVWTHCAVADEPGNDFTAEQLQRFDAALRELRDAGARPELVHAANSAGAIAHPDARRDLVRCGIAIYGVPPSPELASRLPLRPAMTLKALVTYVKPVRAGEAISYGLHHRFDRDSVVATVPIGYADGVSRGLSFTGGQVLVGGRRRPIVGAVTMDQLMVDCGPVGDPAAESVQRGDEVVLIGEQRGERISADEWAQRLDTISYEVVCGIGPRVPRRYVDAD